jgi:hypothetical protein
MVDFMDMPLPDRDLSLRSNLTNRLCNSVKSKIEVAKDIFLYMYKNEKEEEFFIIYEIECACYCSGLHFVLDFEGSENLSLIHFNEQNCEDDPRTSSSPGTMQCMETTVAPFQRKKFGQIRLLNSTRRAKLKYKYSWNMCQVVDSEDMKLTAAELEDRIQHDLVAAARVLPHHCTSHNTSSRFSTLLSPRAIKQIFTTKQQHRDRLTSYMDLSFPPQRVSLLPTSADTLPIETDFPVVWNRPK